VTHPTPPPAELSAASVRRRRLPNGMTLLALADPLVPMLAFHTTWRVGSRNERPGITGISHLFEHMMFNGAKKYGPKMFDRQIESNGGASNAYTTHDVTAYHEVMPSDTLPLVLDLELDRMGDLDLTERNLTSEREVVKEERRLRVDQSPFGTVHEQMMALAFVAHPYRWPVIGWMPDLDAISVADINDYFRTHYTPGNAVVTVAGDIDPERALDETSEVLGRLPAGPPQPPVVRSEPAQRGERRAVVRKEAQLPLLCVAYHGPDASDPDTLALDVAQTILSHGDSSRLQRRLVLDEPLTVDVGADFPWTLDPGLFSFFLTVRPGVEPRRAEDALQGALDRMASEPVSAAELAKAKNQLLADYWRALKTSAGRADQLATYETLCGSCDVLFDLPARYSAVTAEAVQRVSARVFGAENRTVVTLDPVAPTGTSAGDAP